ncbi:MAG: flagellar export protein FliJ [Halanaerobiales bacterium]|nr:flagellar export protein FliJ [Halanaerobiales bacterium]
MKGFRFKFQPILNIKEQEETRSQEEYVILQQAHQEVVESLNQLVVTKEEQINKIQSAESEGNLDINQAILYRNYIAHLHQEIAITTEEEERSKKDMDKGLLHLVEKTKERKIFDKLKEKQEIHFYNERLKAMQNELDDLAQGRFIHQKSKHMGAD